MGAFDYLDQSARPEAAKVRALLEEMLANYPSSHAAEMANRLRTNDETTHNAAFLELCLHEVLVRRGYVVEDVEEPAPGSSKRPDYLVRAPDGVTFYVEATVASGLSDKQLAAERRLGDVLDALRLLQHPRFMVAVQGPKGPTKAVSLNKLRVQVTEWLDTLGPEAPPPPVEDTSVDDEQEHEADAPQEKGSWSRTFAIGDYRLALKAVPRRPGADIRVGIASIAYPLRALSPVDAIRKKLFDKAGRYGNELGRPFFIAVSSTQLLQRDEDFEQATFGGLACWRQPRNEPLRRHSSEPLGSGPWLGAVRLQEQFGRLTGSRHMPHKWLNPASAPTTMSQRSFASAEFALKKKRTRREKFLADMERVVPWARLIAVIEPLYPTSGRVGRQPMGVSKMLRMYLLQQWYGLADEALEDAIYDSQALRDLWASTCRASRCPMPPRC